jgi:hypothetical protein
MGVTKDAVVWLMQRAMRKVKPLLAESGDG